MCTFAAFIPAALSIGSSVAGYVGQSQAAIAQARYQNEMYKQTGDIAAENYRQQTGTVAQRTFQQSEATGQEAQSSLVATMQATSRAAAAAAEAGVGGASVSQLLDDFRRQEAMNIDALRTNQEWSAEQATRDQQALRADAQSRIAQARPRPAVMPSILGTALQIGGSAFSGYDSYLQQTRQGIYNPKSPSSGPSGHWMFRPWFSA